jgi:hypothetical protein
MSNHTPKSLLSSPAGAVKARISLGKAQKWYERLNSAAQGPSDDDDGLGRYRRRRLRAASGTGSRAILTFAVPPAAKGSDVVKTAQARALAARLSLEDLLALSADAARLKEAIFAANQVSGASRAMSEIKLWQQRLALADRATEDLKSAGDAVTVGQLESEAQDLATRLEDASRAALGGGGTQVHLEVQWQTSQEVADMRQEARQALNALDDTLRQANAMQIIDLEVSPAGAAVLGIA